MERTLSLRHTVIATFAILTGMLLCGTLVANWMSFDLEARAHEITFNALPSILHLTAAKDALRDVGLHAEGYEQLPEERRLIERDAITSARRMLDAELTAYLACEAYPGERALFDATVAPNVQLLDAELSAMSGKGRPAAQDPRVRADYRSLLQLTDRLDRSLQSLLRFNAEEALKDARGIAVAHRASSRRGLVLNSLVAVLSVPLGLLILLRLREYDTLQERHRALAESRASELEMFAQRVAHDLLSPLTRLTYCLAPFNAAAASDAKLRDAMVRIRRCVSRAQSLVHGVFDFARAGGKPDPSARSDVGSVVAAVTADVRADASATGVVLELEPFADCMVSCTPAVLTSVLDNLVRNAVKFMSDAELKQISIRVVDRGAAVRVEVADTGPGVPASLEDSIFQPYVRGEGVTQHGLGLGLATVKRLCEAYGGAVGVSSALGRGAVFWFTLPKAETGTASLAPLSAAELRGIG